MALVKPGGAVMIENPFEPPETTDELLVPPDLRVVSALNIVRSVVKFVVTVVVLVLASLSIYLVFLVFSRLRQTT